MKAIQRAVRRRFASKGLADIALAAHAQSKMPEMDLPGPPFPSSRIVSGRRVQLNAQTLPATGAGSGDGIMRHRLLSKAE